MQWHTILIFALVLVCLKIWVMMEFKLLRGGSRLGLSAIPITHATGGSSGDVTIIISGFKSRTPAAFQFLLDSGLLKGAVFYMDYRNLGLNLKEAADSVLRQILAVPHAGQITIISASMGYRVANQVAHWYPAARQIAICPCLGMESLNPRAQKMLKPLPIATKIMNFLDFLTLLPVVPVPHGRPYSLALLLDQYAAVSGETRVKFHKNDLVILADDEDVLNPVVLDQYISATPATIRRVPGHHCDFENHGEEYLAIIKEYL